MPLAVFALVAVKQQKKKEEIKKENVREKEKLKARQRHFIAAQFLKLLHTRELKIVQVESERGEERQRESEREGRRRGTCCAFFKLLKHLQLLL